MSFLEENTKIFREEFNEKNYIGFISGVIFADSYEVVTATSKWNIHSDSPNADTPRFSVLEQQGVLKSAEDKAIYQCKSKGLKSCAAIASSINGCNVYEFVNYTDTNMCEAKAVARGFRDEVETILGGEWFTIKGTSSYSRPNSYSTGSAKKYSELEQFGVQKSAEDNAIYSCKAAGLRDCIILTSIITTCNKSSYENFQDVLKCSSEATAKGYKISSNR